MNRAADPQYYTGCDLSGYDLRNEDFTDCILYGTDLRAANLLGLKISVNCQTFHGVKLDDRNVAVLLKLIALANIAPAWKEGIDALVSSVITPTKGRAIDRFLQIHV